MLTSALLFLAMAAASAVLGIYADSDQGLNEIMYWCAIIFLVTAGGFALIHLARRDPDEE
jgi:hypothetical protein